MMKKTTKINEPSLPELIPTLRLSNNTQYFYELQTHVYMFFLDKNFDIRTAMAFLSSEERDRATAMKDERARRHFTAARSALRLILADLYAVPVSAIEFDYSPNGKPFVKNPVAQARWGFSISHAGDKILIGVSLNREIGVDIEVVAQRQNIDHVLQSLFSPLDYEWVDSGDESKRLERFYKIWCRREATLKAYGKGARYPTRNIDWHLVPMSPASLPDDPLSLGIRGRVYMMDLDVFPRCVASLAIIAQ